MPSDSVIPPSVDEQGGTSLPQRTGTATEVPGVRFSFRHWVTTGMIRVAYRRWTRIAVRLFPENSRSESIARKLHIPLPDTLNMSWVTPYLAVGGRVRSEDLNALSQTGVTHVVDTRLEYSDDAEELGKENIGLLHLPTPDTYPLTVEQLMEGAAWANEQINKDGRVLIHCEHGVGRSVLLTCATLIYGGMQAGDALALVKRKRWQAAPNQRQVARLREFDAAFRAQQD